MEDKEYQEKDLKRGVDYIGVNIIFFCHDGRGNILLHKRGPGCRDEVGTWDCGGGAIEFGETFDEAARREVMEEYGTDPIKIEYVGSRTAIRMVDEKITHWVANLCFVEVDRDKVVNGEPHKLEELGWFPMSSFPEPYHSQLQYDIDMIEKYLAQKDKK